MFTVWIQTILAFPRNIHYDHNQRMLSEDCVTFRTSPSKLGQVTLTLVQRVALEQLETWMLTLRLKLHCAILWWMQSRLLQLTLIRRAWWMSAASWLFHHCPSDSIFPIQQGPQYLNTNKSERRKAATLVQFRHFYHTNSISGFFERKGV